MSLLSQRESVSILIVSKVNLPLYFGFVSVLYAGKKVPFFLNLLTVMKTIELEFILHSRLKVASIAP